MAVFGNFNAYADGEPKAFSPSVFGARGIYELPYLGDGKRVHLMDLYLPKKRQKNLPVIFSVHGGAFTHGSRLHNRGYCAYLASKGFGVLAIDFTDAEDADLATQVRDLIGAMRWLPSNAASYGLDAHTVFLTGDSSGALLALLSYIVGTSDTLCLVYGADKIPFAVKAFGLVSPVTDLRFVTDSVLPQERTLRKKLFGENYTDSPLRYCASIADVLRTETHLPPVWLVSSEDDFFNSQSTQLHHLLNRRNVENKFRFYPACEAQPLPHGFPVTDPERPESRFVNDEMLSFFRMNL